MDYFPRKSLSKYLITDMIDFNKHVHDIDIFINDKWRKYATLQNYKAAWTSLLTNEKVKSTFTRRLLCPNRPPMWTLLKKSNIHKLHSKLFLWSFYFTFLKLHHICVVMVSMLTYNLVDWAQLDQTKDYSIGIWTKANIGWFWIRIMCVTCLYAECYFNRASTIKNQLSLFV